MAMPTERTTAAISPYDQSRMREASEILLHARQALIPVRELPPNLRPATLEEAYHLQDLQVDSLGDIGGWKVGATSPEAVPLFAPMPSYTIAGNGTLIANHFRRLRGVEAEIAFLLKSDLPARAEPYTREEVAAAVAGCCAAIELLESAFLDPAAVDALSLIGDLQTHGGFIHGVPAPGAPSWRDFDFTRETVQLVVNGIPLIENGSNTAGGDLFRLVVWLANEAQERTGGLLAGQWITTGSWTGKNYLQRNDLAEARFGHFGSATVRFE